MAFVGLELISVVVEGLQNGYMHNFLCVLRGGSFVLNDHIYACSGIMHSANVK